MRILNLLVLFKITLFNIKIQANIKSLSYDSKKFFKKKILKKFSTYNLSRT